VKLESQHGAGQVIQILHSPGNGTRYEAVGVKVPFKANEWLISFPAVGCSYYFPEGAHIAFGYLREKMGFDRRGLEISDVDLHEMSKLVATIVKGSHCAVTDAQGTLPMLKIVK
jgi:hypothetical protein